MAMKSDKQARKAKRKGERIRLVLTILREMHMAEAEAQQRQQAAEKARYMHDVVKECAALAGYPRSFGIRLHKRMTVGEVAATFASACRLPVM